MPDDSFVLKYFKFMQEFLSVGPPFYIVVNSTNLNFDYALAETRQKICGAQGCNDDSLLNKVTLWSKVPNKTFVASPAFSWIDDYEAFITSKSPRCCSYYKANNSICFSEDVWMTKSSHFTPHKETFSDEFDYFGDFDGKIFLSI